MRWVLWSTIGFKWPVFPLSVLLCCRAFGEINWELRAPGKNTSEREIGNPCLGKYHRRRQTLSLNISISDKKCIFYRYISIVNWSKRYRVNRLANWLANQGAFSCSSDPCWIISLTIDKNSQVPFLVFFSSLVIIGMLFIYNYYYVCCRMIGAVDLQLLFAGALLSLVIIVLMLPPKSCQSDFEF